MAEAASAPLTTRNPRGTRCTEPAPEVRRNLVEGASAPLTTRNPNGTRRTEPAPEVRRNLVEGASAPLTTRNPRSQRGTGLRIRRAMLALEVISSCPIRGGGTAHPCYTRNWASEFRYIGAGTPQTSICSFGTPNSWGHEEHEGSRPTPTSSSKDHSRPTALRERLFRGRIEEMDPFRIDLEENLLGYPDG